MSERIMDAYDDLTRRQTKVAALLDVLDRALTAGGQIKDLDSYIAVLEEEHKRTEDLATALWAAITSGDVPEARHD
ncbi:hypothetical protein D7I39_10045 [Allopusillimonas ginsengisoli]|nr:hypothetical protein D7I39_10045 [Allopusillimonas ginsengisoli]